jgi:hypothetical protein
MKMLKHKEGDTVHIQSQEWIDAQKKDGGRIVSTTGDLAFTESMFRYAGKTAKIITADEKNNCYKLDVDNGSWWEDWMFDPDYRPEEAPLSAKDAILAMVGGETLYDEDGWEYFWDKENRDLCRRIDGKTIAFCVPNLRRHLPKSNRIMTRWEILAWANSEESRGWLVRVRFHGDAWQQWGPPQHFTYNREELMYNSYQRARLLSDGSGIDEDTIQGFEAEE